MKAEAPATRAKTANAVFMFVGWREGKREKRGSSWGEQEVFVWRASSKGAKSTVEKMER